MSLVSFDLKSNTLLLSHHAPQFGLHAQVGLRLFACHISNDEHYEFGILRPTK